MAGKIISVRQWIRDRFEYSRKKCDYFAERFNVNYSSIDNSDDIFEAAANFTLCDLVLKSLDKAEKDGIKEKAHVNYLLKYLGGEQRSLSKWPMRSTSVTSNLYSQVRLSAISEMIDLLEGWKRHVKEADEI